MEEVMKDEILKMYKEKIGYCVTIVQRTMTLFDVQHKREVDYKGLTYVEKDISIGKMLVEYLEIMRVME